MKVLRRYLYSHITTYTIKLGIINLLQHRNIRTLEHPLLGDYSATLDDQPESRYHRAMDAKVCRKQKENEISTRRYINMNFSVCAFKSSPVSFGTSFAIKQCQPLSCHRRVPQSENKNISKT